LGKSGARDTPRTQPASTARRIVHAEERGKGYAKDALGALIRHLFSVGTHRIEAEVYEFNQQSLGLLKSLGFREEGTKRSAHFDGKRYWNVKVLGLLSSRFGLNP